MLKNKICLQNTALCIISFCLASIAVSATVQFLSELQPKLFHQRRDCVPQSQTRRSPEVLFSTDVHTLLQKSGGENFSAHYHNLVKCKGFLSLTQAEFDSDEWSIGLLLECKTHAVNIFLSQLLQSHWPIVKQNANETSPNGPILKNFQTYVQLRLWKCVFAKSLLRLCIERAKEKLCHLEQAKTNAIFKNQK